MFVSPAPWTPSMTSHELTVCVKLATSAFASATTTLNLICFAALAIAPAFVNARDLPLAKISIRGLRCWFLLVVTGLTAALRNEYESLRNFLKSDIEYSEIEGSIVWTTENAREEERRREKKNHNSQLLTRVLRTPFTIGCQNPLLRIGYLIIFFN